MEKNIEQFIYEEIIKGEGKVTFDYLGKKSIMKAMESYARYKVNGLNKSDVSGNEANPKENKKDGEVAIAFGRWIERNKKDIDFGMVTNKQLFERFKKATDR